MSADIRIVREHQIDAVSAERWKEQLDEIPRALKGELVFMSDEHRLVRNFVVRELPRADAPLTPTLIARQLGLEPERVESLLDDLEKHLFFLVRRSDGSVSWAFPVTVDVTPHRVRFRSGEEIYAA